MRKGFKECIVEVYEVGHKVCHRSTKAEIRIEGSRIKVLYEFEDEKYEYEGMKKGEGHWLLCVTNQRWREGLTLHQWPDSNVLVGDWDAHEHGKGFWRITIME